MPEPELDPGSGSADWHGRTRRPPPAGAGSVVNRCGGGWSAVADAPSAPARARSGRGGLAGPVALRHTCRSGQRYSPNGFNPKRRTSSTFPFKQAVLVAAIGQFDHNNYPLGNGLGRYSDEAYAQFGINVSQ